MKQPAITKHPNGTATFCFRVRLADGAMWEAVSTKPQPIAELVATLQNDYLNAGGYLCRLVPTDTPAPAAEDEPTRMSV
jgi:hypothetical protein